MPACSCCCRRPSRRARRRRAANRWTSTPCPFPSYARARRVLDALAAASAADDALEPPRRRPRPSPPRSSGTSGSAHSRPGPPSRSTPASSTTRSVADPVAVRAPPGRLPDRRRLRALGCVAPGRPDPAVPPQRCAAAWARAHFPSSGARRWRRCSSRPAKGPRRGLPLRRLRRGVAGVRAARGAHRRRPRVQEGRTVSHLAKHTRGEVTRHLLETGADPARPQGLARVLGERWTVELRPPPRPGSPWTIDVVLPVPSSA